MKVSVIIPTYNRFEYVLNAIESVKNQTYKDVEVIVVNDCSTQQEYYTDHPQLMGDNVFLTNLPKNSRDVFGIVSPGGHARNIGMMLASGDYIAFLDDDDYWLPEKLEKQISQMEAHDCKISCTEALFGHGVYDSEKKYKRWHLDHYWQTLKRKKFRRRQSMLYRMYENEVNIWGTDEIHAWNCTCGGSSIVMHKSLIEEAGYFPIMSFADDWAYWKKIIQYSNCVALKEALVYIDAGHGYGKNY